jgi:hypothetical protein
MSVSQGHEVVESSALQLRKLGLIPGRRWEIPAQGKVVDDAAYFRWSK